MKYMIFSLILVAFLFGGIQAQSNLDLKNKPIENELLIEILNDSEIKELKPPSPTASILSLRLFSIGVLGDCAPEVETEVTCSFRYYLAVSDGGLGVPRAVYDLGEVGEILKIQWLENSQLDAARLRLEISDYPKWAYRVNSKLIRKTKTIELEVRLNSLKIKVVK